MIHQSFEDREISYYTQPLNPDPFEPQHLQHLRLANESRMVAARLRSRVASGEITLEDALYNQSCGPLTIYKLLIAQPGWAKRKSIALLKVCKISGERRVSSLTTAECYRLIMHALQCKSRNKVPPSSRS
jgi:hypothetical protein